MMLPGPLMLPPRMLALSRQRLEARIEARMLCLLPRRTERKKFEKLSCRMRDHNNMLI